MSKRHRLLPEEVIDVWPEIFGEVILTQLPFQYIEAILLTFKDGTSWEIDLDRKNKKSKFKDHEQHLLEILESYDDVLQIIDVKIDTSRVKKDVERSIKRMLKRIKL